MQGFVTFHSIKLILKTESIAIKLVINVFHLFLLGFWYFLLLHGQINFTLIYLVNSVSHVVVTNVSLGAVRKHTQLIVKHVFHKMWHEMLTLSRNRWHNRLFCNFFRFADNRQLNKRWWFFCLIFYCTWWGGKIKLHLALVFQERIICRLNFSKMWVLFKI